MDKENIAEFLDDNFFDMELDEQIRYLKENPDKAICPEDVETDYFWSLSQALAEAGEDTLSLKVLELYYQATLKAQEESYYRRISPSISAIYAYGMHLLGDKITPFDEISDDIKGLFISFCVLNYAVDSESVDEVLDDFPQFAVFYENLPEIAYADMDAIYPQLFYQIGQAYKNGTRYFAKNPEKALSYFLEGAELNYDGRHALWPFAKVGDCAFAAAVCYMKGIGTEKDLFKALEYFERGASGHGEDAVPAMGDIYLSPEFPWDQYFDDEEDRYLAAFDAYNTNARSFDGSYMQPATLYTYPDWDQFEDDYDEEKVEKISQIIISHLEKLAQEGFQGAAVRLAEAYETGLFVEEDPARALHYHQLVMVMGGNARSARYVFANTTPAERESCTIPEDLAPGDYVEYGSFFGKPLVWQAIDQDEETTILITKDIVICLPFDQKSANYAESDVRHWLNDVFYHKVFTQKEKESLDINTFEVQSYSRNGCELVTLNDPVLLIAPPEVAEYFGEKIPWEVSHTDLAILTGGKTDCWTRFVHDSHTPRYIDARGEEPAQMRNHISMSLGIRPVITVKRK